MTHWTEVTPGKILLVQHKEVLEDLESAVHRLLDFSGVPFETG